MSGADDEPSPTGLVPYVAASEHPREFSFRAVTLGLILSILFNAANAYVGLKIGLTVSASIPSAVLSMALLRKVLPGIRRLFGMKASAPGTILENNIVHAIASTGEALAAGMIFTLPAFYFLTGTPDANGSLSGGTLPSEWQSFLYGTLGGCLGLLAMVPLRRPFTVEEHGKLPFPEGVACAKVLIAGDSGGVSAGPVFFGMAIGGAGKVVTSGLGLVRESVFRSFTTLHKAALGFEPAPLLLGVGYLIGVRVAAMMLAGSLLGQLVLIPLIDWLGQDLSHPLAPATHLIRDMDAAALRASYIKFIGAGGVTFGGAYGILRTLPQVRGAVRASLRGFVAGRSDKDTPRTERDLSMRFIGAGLLAVGAGIMLLPTLHSSTWGFGTVALLGALAVAFSFFFVAVSARTVGLVGSTSQPVSGMTITAVVASSLLIAGLGHTGHDARFAAMTLGALVCISICLSGDMAQDLKTAALLGATPRAVQMGQLIGTVGAAVRAGFILWLLHRAYRLGSAALPAPQADLMAQLVRGAMGGDLPWILLLLGAGIGLVVELCGISALAFSIGLYLPPATWPPIFVGGLAAWILERRSPSGPLRRTVTERATLFASGLVAGDALTGIAISMLAVWSDRLASRPGGPPFTIPFTRLGQSYGALTDVVPLAVFLLYVGALFHFAKAPRSARGFR